MTPGSSSARRYLLALLIVAGIALGTLLKWFFDLRQERNAAMSTERCLIQNLLAGDMVIDSQVWMDSDYLPFFYALRAALEMSGRKMVLYRPQWEEFRTIDKEFAYGTRENAGAKLALGIVDSLHEMGLLGILSLKILTDPGASVSLRVLHILGKGKGPAQRIALVSCDGAQEAQAREALGQGSGIELHFVDVRNILDGCQALVSQYYKQDEYNPTDDYGEYAH